MHLFGCDRVDEEDQDDPDDEAFNETDENKIAKQFRCTFTGKKTSKHKFTKQANKNLWHEHDKLDANDVVAPHLCSHCIMSATDVATDRSNVVFKRDLDLTDPRSVRQMMHSQVCKVENGPTVQIDIGLSCDQCLHGMLGPKGGEELESLLMRSNKRVILLKNNRDYLPDPKLPLRPVTTNTTAICSVQNRKAAGDITGAVDAKTSFK